MGKESAEMQTLPEKPRCRGVLGPEEERIRRDSPSSSSLFLLRRLRPLPRADASPHREFSSPEKSEKQGKRAKNKEEKANRRLQKRSVAPRSVSWGGKGSSWHRQEGKEPPAQRRERENLQKWLFCLNFPAGFGIEEQVGISSCGSEPTEPGAFCFSLWIPTGNVDSHRQEEQIPTRNVDSHQERTSIPTKNVE
ncbi:uncharacterized protein [Phaenicophaeus curvirostris]|uniref:uncharacterized protein isoform X2 n=1 Tax=Phaenicophaeus curvirostris TaxID=33595 RepID=UPI0037F09F2B